MTSNRRNLVTGATAGCLMFTVGQAQGAGFAIIEQGVSGLGNAYAGGAAAAEEASTVYFNPAGMTRLHGSQFVGAVHVISPTAEFEGSASVAGVVPVSGGDGGGAGETAIVPNLYYVRDLNDSLTFGLGVNAPFGLTTDYDDDWVGRYHALRSEVRTVNLNPALAWKVGDRLSIGAGVNLQYIDVPDLSQAIDFGALAGVPTSNDGHVKLEGDDLSWGFNIGFLYELDQDTRMGLAYRSKVDHQLDGSADFTGTAPGTVPPDWFQDGPVSADITMPETLSLSVYHDLNPRWAIMGDVTWTRWSRFDELRVQFDTTSQPDMVTPQQWDDSRRYSLGLSYRPTDRWTLRTGVAFDESPVPSAELRTPRIPGNDRRWLAFGASYRQSEQLWLDVGYAHLFVSDTPINNTSGAAILSGNYDASVDILSAQVRWNFR